MKKLITLLLAAGFVTVASAQQGRRYDNSYQSSPYSYNDQYRNDDRYERNSPWNDRGDRYERNRRRIARERYEYEMMMKRRAQERYYNQRRYES